MRVCHSCSYDPDLFRKVRESVTIQQVVEYYELQVNRKGLCLCPFHQDKSPSMKIYPNGKGFYCFTCGVGGDLIRFVALYQNLYDYEAAKELATIFGIPVSTPVTYREKREAEKAMRRRRDIAAFGKRALLWVSMYRILLCEAIHERNEHAYEALKNLTYTEYLLDVIRQYPESIYDNVGVVRKIGEIEGRIINWHIRIEADGTISGRNILSDI